MAFPSVLSRSTLASIDDGNYDEVVYTLPSHSAGDLAIIIWVDEANSGEWTAETAGWTTLASGGYWDWGSAPGIGVYAKKLTAETTATFRSPSYPTASAGWSMICILIDAGTWDDTGDLTDSIELNPDCDNVGRSGAGTLSLSSLTLTPTGGAKDYLWFVGAGIRDDEITLTTSTTGVPTGYSNFTAVNAGEGVNNCSSIWIVDKEANASSETPGDSETTHAQWHGSIQFVVHPAADTGGANPHNPLGHPLKGPFGGPIG